jgi:hypothetical protein
MNPKKIVQIPQILNVGIPKRLTIIGPTTAPKPYNPYERLTICLGSYLAAYIKSTLIRTYIDPIEKFMKKETNARMVEF